LIDGARRAFMLAAGLWPLWPGTPPVEPPTGAQEWRVVAREGVVRIYRPGGFRARDAALVLYVHGLYTDVDRAWREHRLPEQFEASGRNALFVVPAARTAAPDPLPWPALPALLETVGAAVGQPLPAPVVAAGHSGAYKLIAGWLGHPRLQTVLLLDGLYGLEPAFRAWLDSRGHRMALVGQSTAAAVAKFARRAPYSVRRHRCPDEFAALTARERTAKLLAMGTEADHFGIVTDGKILPLLLQWAGIAARP
jgi:hypothetical protein